MHFLSVMNLSSSSILLFMFWLHWSERHCFTIFFTCFILNIWGFNAICPSPFSVKLRSHRAPGPPRTVPNPIRGDPWLDPSHVRSAAWWFWVVRDGPGKVRGGPGRSWTVRESPGGRFWNFKLFKKSGTVRDDPGRGQDPGRSLMGRDGAGIARDGTAAIPASSVAATALSWTIRGYREGSQITDTVHNTTGVVRSAAGTNI